MLYIVPLESLHERYTEQWSRWIPKALNNLKLRSDFISPEFVEIKGEQLTSKIEIGSVLDVYGTNYYKFSQLQSIIQLFHNNHVDDETEFWFADLWFPGIEALFYIRDMTGIKFKITGVLHAGTWDENDFTYKHGMQGWGKHIERGWLKQFDKIYVGSQYHKDIITERVFKVKDKIYVTGLFFDCEEVGGNSSMFKPKENIVVFPHRLDAEKNPQLFDEMAVALKKKYPNWSFIKTKDVCSNKKEYYGLLARAKIAVSFADQETFGYAMLESIANGCIPIVPNKLSYSTMSIYNGYKYDNFSHAVDMVRRAISDDIGFNHGMIRKNLKQYEPYKVFKRMLANENIS